MTISFPHGLPPDVVHQLLFSFHHYEVKYANSTQLMLAMPNAGGDRQLGNLLLLRDLAGAYPARFAHGAVCLQRSARAPCGRCLRLPLSGLIHQLKFSVARNWRQRWHDCCYYAFARGRIPSTRPARQRPAVAATSMATRLQSKRP